MMYEISNLFRLDGKVCLIAGGEGLIGREIARALTMNGAFVYIGDIDLSKDGGNGEIEVIGKNRFRGLLDVTSKDSWENMVSQIIEKHGRIDCLINTAAVTNSTRAEGYDIDATNFPLDVWNSILEVNLTGTFLGIQIVGLRMVQQQAGSIITFGSLYGVVSPNHRIYEDIDVSQPPAYAISKAGVIALTRYFGTLWAESSVRVNCITPGGIEDKQPSAFVERFAALCPQGRMQKKEEIIGGVLYLCSDASNSVIGHNLTIDGGWTAW